MLALLLASSIAAADIHGAWNALVKDDRVHLTVVRNHSDWGHSFPRSDFAISDADINSTAEKPVQFSLKRDAGTIDFTGTFENGEGVGRFKFTPNPSYPETLRSMGVAFDSTLDDERLFSLAMHDISAAFIRDMQALGYRENLESYVRFRIHGVTTDFVRELRSLGYDKLSAQELVRFRIHGVSPQFIRDMKALGYSVTSEELVRFRIHGVSTDFVRELRDLGYRTLSSEDLVRMRIHGVSTSFIRELAEAGYHGIPAEKLIQMRIHGIDASTLPGKKD